MPISFTFDQPPPDHLTQWFTKASASNPHLHIHIQATTLGLHLHTSSHPLPDLTLNLGDAQHRFLARSLSKKQPLWRALQWKTRPPHLICLTLLQDLVKTVLFLHMGAKVVSIEGDPLIAAILGYAVWKIKKTPLTLTGTFITATLRLGYRTQIKPLLIFTLILFSIKKTLPNPKTPCNGYSTSLRKPNLVRKHFSNKLVACLARM